MPTSTQNVRFSDLPTDYPALVAMLPPREIHDQTGADNVEEVVMALAGHELNTDQDDYLALLSDLLEKWQLRDRAARLKRLQARPVPARLAYVMEQSGTTPRDLEAVLDCSHTLVSLMLSGKRDLSRPSLQKLSRHFAVSADYFL